MARRGEGHVWTVEGEAWLNSSFVRGNFDLGKLEREW